MEKKKKKKKKAHRKSQARKKCAGKEWEKKVRELTGGGGDNVSVLSKAHCSK